MMFVCEVCGEVMSLADTYYNSSLQTVCAHCATKQHIQENRTPGGHSKTTTHCEDTGICRLVGKYREERFKCNVCGKSVTDESIYMENICVYCYESKTKEVRICQ